MPRTAAAGPGQSPRLRPRQRERHRPQHRRSGALEALSRRHRRPSVDRRRRQRHVPAHDRARRQHHEPDVDRRAASTSCRTPKASATCIRAFPTAADLRAPHRSRRLLRAPRADRRPAHRLPVRRRALAVRSRRKRHGAQVDDRSVPSHRTQAARKFVPAADHLGAFNVHPAGPQRRARRARQAVHVRAVGRRGAPARRRPRRRALSPRAMAGRRRDAGRGQRRSRAKSASSVRRTARRARCRGTSAASSRMRAAPRARASRSPIIATR